MRKILPLAVLAILILATSAFAGVDFNELQNPSFINGGEGYDIEGAVFFNGDGTPEGGDPVWGRTSIAYTLFGEVPAAVQNPTSKISQVVDDALHPAWNPDWNAKTFEWNGWYYTAEGSVTLHIGYWNDVTMDRPTPDMAPDRVLSFILPETDNVWEQWNVCGTLPTQPRWLRLTVEFTCGGAAVDDMEFESICVPEPSSMLAIFGGLAGLGGFAIRRRK